MSSLPPYSTYRTDNKQMMFPQATSHGNILTFTPPGFRHALNVKFPDSRLPVCEKCKKNFKTRDMCRVRNAHTGAPWTTAYICITLDASCTDENGKYIDKPLTVRMVQWQPYCVHRPFEPKTPVCASCKKTNRTRSFCRERHKHRQLPWCTVYVLLSALDQVDPQTLVAAPSKLVDDSEDGADSYENTPTKIVDGIKTEVDGKQDTVAGTPSFDSAQTTLPTSEESKNEKKKDGAEDGDDINDIAEGRTFLAKVSSKCTTIHWLELAEFDASDQQAMAGYVAAADGAAVASMNTASMQVDPNQAQYYAHYAAQQHQHALKSHQQYFFQMHQQRQQEYAQQQAAWQAHYQGPPMPPTVAGQPAPHQQHAPASEPAPVPAPARPPGEVVASPPVTAGEAAAQQRRNRQAARSAAPTPAASPAPPSALAPTPTAGEAAAASAAAAQQQQQQQQQPPPPWQIYQQPMYATASVPLPPHGYAPHAPQAHGGPPPPAASPAADPHSHEYPPPPPPPQYVHAPVQYAPPHHYQPPYSDQHYMHHQQQQQQQPMQHHHAPPVQHQQAAHAHPAPAPQHHASQHPAPATYHQTRQDGATPQHQPVATQHEHPERPSDENPAKRHRT